jgi:hypothetical protein
MNVIELGVLLLSILPLYVLFRYDNYKSPRWVIALAGAVSAVLAVVFYLVWQRLQYPVLAYVDAGIYGLFALQAVTLLVATRAARRAGVNLGPRDPKAADNSQGVE